MLKRSRRFNHYKKLVGTIPTVQRRNKHVDKIKDEQKLTSAPPLQSEAQEVKITGLDLLAEIERERAEWRSEREELQRQLNPQVLLYAMLTQLGVSIREYQPEATLQYSNDKPSKYENFQQPSGSVTASEIGHTQISSSLTKENKTACYQLVRRPVTKLKQIYAFWRKFRRLRIPKKS